MLQMSRYRGTGRGTRAMPAIYSHWSLVTDSSMQGQHANDVTMASSTAPERN
jgi:hypothetical protein